jgi:Sec-independent protein translocase protein TatA
MLIVVGPERLPSMAYQIGRAVRTMQKYARAVRDEFSDEIEYIEEQYRTVKGEVDTARVALREQDAQLKNELKEVMPASLDLLPAADTRATPANVVNIDERRAAENETVLEPVPPPGATVAEPKEHLLF